MNNTTKKMLKTNPFREPLITPATIRMEGSVNKSMLQSIIDEALIPEEKNINLLSEEYFSPVAEELSSVPYREGYDPYYHSGFAPSGNYSILDSNAASPIAKAVADSIVLNLNSKAGEGGWLPGVLRHEYKHKNLPLIKGDRNYGYILPKNLQEFLSSYNPDNRGEELAAEMFAGRRMPVGLFNVLRKKLNQETGYDAY